MGGIRRKKKFQNQKNKKDKDGKDRSDHNKREAGQPGNFKDIVRENAMYEKFYGAMNICDDKEELDRMVETMKKDLPASFRVTGFRSQVKRVKRADDVDRVSKLMYD
jgi:hypothetical protein